jgi:hypothetical protein
MRIRTGQLLILHIDNRYFMLKKLPIIPNTLLQLTLIPVYVVRSTYVKGVGRLQQVNCVLLWVGLDVKQALRERLWHVEQYQLSVKPLHHPTLVKLRGIPSLLQTATATNQR